MSRRLVVILAVFCVLRVWLSYGPPIRYNDSPSYENLAFRGVRLWVVPFAYSIVRPDRMRVIAQVTAGVLAWGFAAMSLASTMAHRRMQVAAAILVAAHGLTPQVTQWDSLILSESASISLLAMTFGVVVQYAVRPSRWLAACVVGSMGMWALTRHLNVLVLLVGSVTILVVGLLKGSRRAMSVSASLLALALVGLLGFAGGEAIWRYNSNAILTNRVLESQGGIDYFVRAGLPGPTPEMMAWVGRFSGDAPQLEDAALQSWINARWSETYGRYLASHPRPTVVEPLGRVPKLWASDLQYRTAKTWLADRASGFSLREGAVLLALFTTAGAVAFGRRKRPDGDKRNQVVAVGLGGAVVASFLTWHLSATELARLMLPWALLLRLSLVLYILVGIDNMLSRSEPAGSTAARA